MLAHIRGAAKPECCPWGKPSSQQSPREQNKGQFFHVKLTGRRGNSRKSVQEEIAKAEYSILPFSSNNA